MRWMNDRGGKRKLKAFNLSQVRINEPYCKNAYQKELAYLGFLKADCLLAGFREVAGLPKKASRYLGWESTEIQGHTLGHYLSALSQAYNNQGLANIKEKIDYICKELRMCQQADGFLFASPQEIFDRVERQQPAWVPWYTMHKLFQGLLSAYRLGKNQVAYDILVDLGEWVYNRTSKWTEEVHQQVLKVEYGGMNAALYELYQITENEHFKLAARQFDEQDLFDALYDRQDILNGLHANTTIPKVVGAVERYLVEGEAYYLKVAQNFWEIVVSNHTYCTGGNSEWEHFGEPNILDRERTACNCETCNVYNMLKLTKLLFEITGDKKYGDFYERTWMNSVLASQNPETGMTTYFQPMETGYFKVFGSPHHHFWCCTGTGMENFTKLGEGIYFQNDGAIYINRYLSSQLAWEEKQIKLHMKADLLEVEQVELNLEAPSNQKVEIYFRLPWWNVGQAKVYVDGKETVYSEQEGYGYIVLYGGQSINLHFEAKVSYETLPDHEAAVAFMYGPIVLCGELGTEMMTTTKTGVDVSVPRKDFFIKDYLLLTQDKIKDWLEQIELNLTKAENEMKFELHGTDEDQKIHFRPYFSEYKQRYGIYWYLLQKGSKEQLEIDHARQKKLEHMEVTLDCVPVGNDQYELSHLIKGENTLTSGLEGHRCRFIKGKGWFAYTMKGQEKAKYLNVTYSGEEVGSTFEIWINGQFLTREKLKQHAKAFYIQSYELPSNLLDWQKENIEVMFRTENEDDFCRIFDELVVSTKRIH